MNSQPLVLEQQAIDAIVRGDQGDIFSVLGPHQASRGKYRLTVFLPGAQAVQVIEDSGKNPGELERVHEEGLFTGLVENGGGDFVYKLRVDYPLTTVEVDDPYRFPSLLDEHDRYLFNNGTHEQAYRFMGANHRRVAGVAGVLFSVWAPNAKRVSVVGDFNHWDGRVHVMRKHGDSGIWEIFLPAASAGDAYKYEILAADGRALPLKADPYARRMQLRPDTASLVPGTGDYAWGDQDWMRARRQGNKYREAVSVYEVHLGSWKRKPERGNGFLTYRELVDDLLPYVKVMGFTHIQLMPVSEHPFDGSWGYQPLGLFAPSSRFGDPEDFRHFIDAAHRAGIGVLLDWVPAHFPSDAHGLAQFDGTHLYEHADPRLGFHPDWNTLIFNYGRAEVATYLISNALYWLEEFHVDGLRFDAVASMLYLDYSRKAGEWLPNSRGGRENLEATALLRTINSRAYFNYPGVMMIAEESTAWPGVTDFIDRGGLGFGFKWNLGWMNDTLSYLSRDPIHRRYHHNEMTFGLLYAFSENFILPLSHDEVVHGKRALLEKIPGDDWRKFATLRAYYCFMWTHPGKKLLFMGSEIGQRREWSHDRSLDWHLLEHPPHRQLQQLVSDINAIYRDSPPLFEEDYSPEGFEWIDADNHGKSVFIYLRKSREQRSLVLVVLNMTPEVQQHFRIGVPGPGHYRQLLNTNDEKYGGSGFGGTSSVRSEKIASHGRAWSIELALPPLAALLLAREAD